MHAVNYTRLPWTCGWKSGAGVASGSGAVYGPDTGGGKKGYIQTRAKLSFGTAGSGKSKRVLRRHACIPGELLPSSRSFLGGSARSPVTCSSSDEKHREVVAPRQDKHPVLAVPQKVDLDSLTNGNEAKRQVLELLLAAILVAGPFTPTPAEALQLQIMPEANIVGQAVKQAAGVVKAAQQNKVVEKAVGQVEAQVQGILSPEVRDLFKEAGEYLHLDAVASSLTSGLQTLQSTSQQVESSLGSSLESAKTSAEQLAGDLSLTSDVTPSLDDLRRSVSDLAGGVSVDPALQNNLESLQRTLESSVQGVEWEGLLWESLLRLQAELVAFQDKVTAGIEKIDQPVLQALGSIQDSIDAALNNLGNTAGDALNFVPFRVPYFVTAAKSFISRFGLFELWGFVSGFVERSLVIGPGLVLLAAGWNALGNRRQKRQREEQMVQGPSLEVQMRSARVRRELAKLEVKGQLSEAVRRLGRAALAPSTDPSSAITRQEVESLIRQLKDMRPRVETALLGASSSDPFAEISPAPDIDGEWELIYSTEPLETRGLSPGQLTDLLPDFAMAKIMQRVTSQAQGSFSSGIPQPAPIKVAENSANVTLGSFGTFRISVQGKWEEHDDDVASVSFDSFSAHPLEVLGKKLEGVPEVQLPVPAPLRQSVEWSTLYVDEDTRISQSKRGTYYLFKRSL